VGGRGLSPAVLLMWREETARERSRRDCHSASTADTQCRRRRLGNMIRAWQTLALEVRV